MSLPASAAVPSPSATEAIEEVVQEVDRKTPQHTDITAQPVAAPATEEPSTLQDFQQAAPSLAPEATAMADVPEAVEEGSDKPSDTVDSPVVPPPPQQQQPSAGQEIPVEAEEPRAASPEKKPENEEEKENVKKSEKDEQVSSTKAAAAVEVPVPPGNVAEEEMEAKSVAEVSEPPPPSEPEPAAPPPEDVVLHSPADQEPTQVEAEAAPLSNGLPQETEELFEKTPVSDTTSPDESNTSPTQESTPAVKSAAPAQVEEDNKEEQKKKVDDTPASVSCPEESTMQSMEMFFIYHLPTV